MNPFVDPILEHYRARIPDARRFALERRVLLVETRDGIPLDISLGGLPYEAVVVDRSSPFEIERGISLTTCSAEDLTSSGAYFNRHIRETFPYEPVVIRYRQACLAGSGSCEPTGFASTL